MFGIRPEHLELAGDTNGGGLKAQVHVVEPTGADTQVMCHLGKSEVAVVARDRVSCVAGDAVVLVPDLARAHLFDAGTGKRLTG